MAKRTIKQTQEVLSGQVGVGYSSGILVADFQHISFVLSTIASSNQRVKVRASRNSPSDEPDFTAARTTDNSLFYLQFIEDDDSTAFNGSVGVLTAGVDVRGFVANTPGINWIAFEVSAGTTGAVTIDVNAYNNE